ncbi:hypothetical protein GCK72_020233 [Caenorhabditis remanei]|uniref:T20D4.11-like domain-containing protein n=1 Tax=Caenorhabditis remanei TaxID=31234 RepID=A0A2P4UYS7_CAERE|nr:hypothetical protein GCK72_020233 [Caenorhabditis remanei]KAF1753676.1 hypothetical protein GCK72_020233 [Caenorhabditis remanei]
MGSIFILFLFQAIVTYADPKVQIDDTVKDCTPKELVVAQGKCSKYVNDLIVLTEEGDTKSRNVTDACKSVTSCFGGIQCAEAEKSKRTYEQKCDKLEFTNNDVASCMSMFYNTVYSKKENCTEDFDYFSRDMRIKRESYTAGKSCFFKTINKTCNATSVAYLEKNYEKLLDVLTIPSDGDACSSLHDELNARQCEPQMREFMINGMIQAISMSFGMKERSNTTKTCSETKECMSQYCYFSKNTTQQLEQLCDELSKKPTTFNMCYMGIRMSTLDTKEPANYECQEKYGRKPMVEPVNKALEKQYLKFMDDKECMRTIMKEECDQSVLDVFDEEWDKLQKEKNSRTSTRSPF